VTKGGFVLATELSPETQAKFEPLLQESPGAFALRDCALIAIATGTRAQNLKELHDRIETTDTGCVYYHFWGGLLRPRFDDPEYRNDFAIWARNELHDESLAERLALIDPTQHDTLEGLREAVLETLETRMEETQDQAWLRTQNPFHFVRSQIVVFDTGQLLRHPEQLAQRLPHLSLGSIYYHFIDARRRVPDRIDDFRMWLRRWGDRYRALCERLAEVDYYFVSLHDLRVELAQILGEYFEIPPTRLDEEDL
jgi:Family of unknown function (DUF5752)